MNVSSHARLANMPPINFSSIIYVNDNVVITTKIKKLKNMQIISCFKSIHSNVNSIGTHT